MKQESQLILWLLVWIVAIAVVSFRQLRVLSGAGLVLAYVVNLWIIHWVATALYAIPGYSYYSLNDVVAGLEQSAYAIVAFSAGYLIVEYVLEHVAESRILPTVGVISSGMLRGSAQGMIGGEILSHRRLGNQSHVHLFGEGHVALDIKLIHMYIGIGAVCYLLNVSGISKLPTLTSIVAGGFNFLIAGMMLKAWLAWWDGNRRSLLFWLSVSSAFPVLTIITQGYLGYGLFNTVMIVCFVAKFYRPKWRLFVVGLIVGYLGLSVYVTYMRDRADIRHSVWGGQSYESRIDQLESTFSQAEFFNITNDEHLERIDLRLNQNALVGASVHYIESGRQELARGETLWQAIIAFIPRAIWPEKPVTAGSGNLVSQYTGYYFGADTSVGIGHVMEFYVNFGRWGVIIGFLGMGAIIAVIDRCAGENLARGKWLNFACWYLPGAAFLQVGGSLVEVTASAGSSLAIAMLLKYFVSWSRQGESRKRTSSHLRYGSQAKL